MDKMKARPLGHEATVPAGTYFLGDPCYFVPDDDWMHVLDSSDFFRDPIATMRDGTQVLAFQTYQGDGQYRDQFGHVYGVDAGLIGLTPVTPATEASAAEYGPGSTIGQRVTFVSDVTCTGADGVMQFGQYAINTKDEDEDDEDDLGYGLRDDEEDDDLG